MDGLVSLFLLALCLRLTSSDLFSAIADLEGMLQVERDIANDLRNYVANEEIRLRNLNKIADDFEKHSRDALKNPEKHLGNPINAYLLVKRFTDEWNDIVDEQIKKTSLDSFLTNISTKASKLPTEEDLQGAAFALMRLQDTYALSSSKIAAGELKGMTDSVLSAGDCFKLGYIAYTKSDYYHTIIWMNEALKLSEKTPIQGIGKSIVLDYLGYSYYKQGNIRRALNITKQWLTLEPDHSRGLGNMKYYEQLIHEEEAGSRRLGEEHDPDANPRPMDEYTSSNDFRNYEKLCRGEKTHNCTDEHKFTCRYVRHHPFLYIRPAREELVSWEPKMYLFHDVMTDKQVNKIKELGRPKLSRSVVYHKSDSEITTAQSYRISKSGWLKDQEDQSVAKFSFMAGILSNLTLETAEELQVLNYGIGGHYEPHYDFTTNSEHDTFEIQIGNRIATFICYLSDVLAGGATVFPGIGVSYWPKKAKCAFWYNLKRSGEGDMRTRHAACPVLSGIKWACNKWFHERGQEFIRPCTTSVEE